MNIPTQHQQSLNRLVEVFLEENAKLNLSAHRTNEKVWEANVMDSLAGLSALEEFCLPNSAFRILDLGTGGGFPLLPLAITLPQHHFTGLDSVRKKIDAVQRITDTLNLPNISLIAGRAEELGKHHAHREKYDVVMVRAVAETSTLLEYCSPFVKIGGHILLWKSIDVNDEISSASRAESQLFIRKNPSVPYNLGAEWGKRQILIYEKIKATPKEYPRQVGSAKKNPL